MILFKKAHDLNRWLTGVREQGRQTGFVPTMGALHAGHISLAETCSRENDVCLVSIFVNPTQFNDPKDFEKYPVSIENDIDRLLATGCDALFLPSVDEMYPEGTDQGNRHFDIGYLENILEGKHRPGHFQGVCGIVDRLLDLVMPHRLYLGRKDYQQCMVIRKLIALKKLDGSVEPVICPTLREPDGLAMSSRNLRLTGQDRERAGSLYASLLYIKENIGNTPAPELEKRAENMLTEKGLRVDYVAICDAESLEPAINAQPGRPLVALAAAYCGEVRLIDNLAM